MALLPSIASNIVADLLTKPLPAPTHHRYSRLAIGDSTLPPTSTTSVAPTLVASIATVDSLALATVVASTPTVNPLTAVVDSDSVPIAPTLPIVLDTGASYSRTPSPSDFALEVTQASYGLFRSPISVVSKALASTPVDPYTLITGEDAVAFDLLSPSIDFASDIDSDLGPSFTKVSFDIRQFGTASLTFIFSPNLSLIKVFVTPTQVDWIHWVPLPRLILPESYFHIFGLDYLQAFTLFHLIPIWIYCLLHFAVTLED